MFEKNSKILQRDEDEHVQAQRIQTYLWTLLDTKDHERQSWIRQAGRM